MPRLIPKGILGISIWVTVLIDKYLLYRPTYRLLADLRAHGLDWRATIKVRTQRQSR